RRGLHRSRADLLEMIEHVGGQRVQRRGDQIVLAGEVVVDGGFGDVGALSNLFQAGALVAVGGQDAERDAHDLRLAPVAAARDPAGGGLARRGAGRSTRRGVRARVPARRIPGRALVRGRRHRISLSGLGRCGLRFAESYACSTESPVFQPDDGETDWMVDFSRGGSLRSGRTAPGGSVDFEDIRYEIVGSAAVVTIDRPHRYNAFRGQTVEELIHAFRTAWADKAVRAIVLTGSGDKAFCTGGDVKQRAETGDYGPTTSGLFEIDNFHRLIRDVPKPVIAAVNGLAIGGGH